MNSVNYMQVVPNSHSFGSLVNILYLKKYDDKNFTKEYILIGLKNCLKRETDIRIVDNANENYDSNIPAFTSISEIIKYLEHDGAYPEEFIKIIENTLNGGLDLKCKRKMERSEVYKKIDVERDYQDAKWTPRREANGTPDEEKPIAEWINYMEYHLEKAKNRVYFLNDEEALAEVRKVTALGVRCMEIHGCPDRVIPEELLNEE